jgi:phosphopantetheinyl transferase
LRENERDMLPSNDRRRQKREDRGDLEVASMRIDVDHWSRAELDDALRRSDALVLTTTVGRGAQNSDDLFSALTESERARYATFANPVLATRFATARSTLRHILGSLVGQPPREIAILVGPHGKPHLSEQAQRAPLWFNVAHSDDIVLIALSRRAHVGVDIERLRPVDNWRQVAERVLTPTERVELHRDVDAGADPGEALLVRWCRLEAELKAIGMGLDALHARDARQRTGVRVRDLDEIRLTPGHVASPSRYHAAVALWSPESVED